MTGFSLPRLYGLTVIFRLKAEKFSRACLNLFFLVTAQSTVTSKVVKFRGCFLSG